MTQPRYLGSLLILAFILTLCITELSSYIRLDEAGSGCSPWPACYAHMPQLQMQDALPDPAVLTPHHTLKRIHRIIASLLVIICIPIIMSIGRIPYRSTLTRRAPILLFFALLLLSIIGPFTPQKQYPIIAACNILLGILLLVIFSRCSWDLHAQGKTAVTLKKKDKILLGWNHHLIILALIAGAWSSANFAATLAPLAKNTSTTVAGILSAFSPFRSLSMNTEGYILADASTAVIYNTHITLSIISLLTGILLLSRCIARYPRLRTNAGIVIALFIANLILGLIAHSSASPHLILLTHHLLSILLLLSSSRLTYIVHREQST